MNICVTGGTGFIGKYLVKNLLSKGHQVTALDINKEDIDGIDFVQIDFTNYKEIKDALKGFDVVYHFGGGTLVSTVKNPKMSVESSLVGTANVIESCIKNSVKKIIYASSASVYNGFPENEKVDENMISHPFKTELFGAIKILGERLIYEYSKKNNFSYVILRLGPVFGLEKRCTSVICDLIESTLEKKTFEIWGDGKRLLQPTFVEDVAEGCALSLNSSNEVYNVISPERYSIIEIAEMLKTKYGLNFSTDGTKPSGQEYPHISPQRLIDELKWKNTPLLQAFGKIIDGS